MAKRTTSVVSTSAEELARSDAWRRIKAAALAVRPHQIQDGSIPNASAHADASVHVDILAEELERLANVLPHDRDYLVACANDFRTWAAGGFDVPDFYDSLDAFRPAAERRDGIAHVVVFPMYTQNGSRERLVEAVVFDLIWPEHISDIEAATYTNPMFLPVRFYDFTPGYDTNSATLFPESVAVTPRVPLGAPEGSAAELPAFTWGAIFADREAARFRAVVNEAVRITHLELPEDAQRLLADQSLAEETFVLWDLIHDRTHMRGDLPFDPFMIKQRMPFFLYGLEELRCDLTAFRECVDLIRDDSADSRVRELAKLVLYAVLFDRIFRFPLTGSRERNYDGVAGQLLFAWLHQARVLHWTDTSLAIDWDELPDTVVSLSDAINNLYWESIDRPKTVHWLAAYDLVSQTLAPHPASKWATRDFPLDGTPSEYTDAVLDDEFPLSMFYEALGKKMRPAIEAAIGITGLRQ
jgi:hypothetical protein